MGRFKGVHSNGALPGGLAGWRQRNRFRTYGVTPIVNENKEKPQPQRREKRKATLEETGPGSGVWRLR